MAGVNTLTIKMKPQAEAALVALAEAVGAEVLSGPNTGRASWRTLVNMIGRGELAVVGPAGVVYKIDPGAGSIAETPVGAAGVASIFEEEQPME